MHSDALYDAHTFCYTTRTRRDAVGFQHAQRLRVGAQFITVGFMVAGIYWDTQTRQQKMEEKKRLEAERFDRLLDTASSQASEKEGKK
jgi:hypothetical protein